MEPEPASLFLTHILLSTNWMLLSPILLIILLLICSALISGSEIAFFSLSPQDIQGLQKDNTEKSKRILKLRENPPKLLATILITNNLVNIGIILLSDLFIKQLFPNNVFEKWGVQIAQYLPWEPSFLGSALSFLITVLITSFLLVLFGEVLPKIYASVNNLGFAKFMERPMNLLNRVFSPLSNRLIKSTSIFETRLSANPQVMDPSTKEELEDAIDFSVSQSIYEDEQADILRGILKFGDVTVKQIMKSRMDIFAVENNIDFKEMFKLVQNSGFSRIPVFEEELDVIIGLLYVKDLLGYHKDTKEFDWLKVVRDNVLYVPESKKISDLLKEFQSKRLHMAIVVDEFGGTSGLVTLEDIMEEVIGEITDEFDDEHDQDYIKIDEHNYIFEGKTLLNDVCRVIGEDIDIFDEAKKTSDSLAGLILEMHGQIPPKGFELSHTNFKFRIIEVNKRRIEKIKLQILDPIEESEG